MTDKTLLEKSKIKCLVCLGSWKKKPLMTTLDEVDKLNLCTKHRLIFNSINGGKTLI